MERNTADTSAMTAQVDASGLRRLFIALETNAAVQVALLDAQQTLKRRGELPVRWVQPGQMHLTLQFLGNVMAGHVSALAIALRRAVVPHRAFLLRAGAVGTFPATHAPRVLWLDVRGDVDALMTLQRDVSRAARQVDGVVTDRKPFRPHLTLGRVRDGKGDMSGQNTVAAARTRPITLLAAAWPIAEVALIHSVLGTGGPRYTVLERFPLKGGEVTDAGGPTI